MVEDDLEPLITRCPNCNTQFRVTESQLAVAGGRVRCGACLTVFQGTDYLLLDEASAFTTGSEADAALDALLNELNDPGPDGSATADAHGDTDSPRNSEMGPHPALEGTLEPADLDEPPQFYAGFEDEETPEVVAPGESGPAAEVLADIDSEPEAKLLFGRAARNSVGRSAEELAQPEDAASQGATDAEDAWLDVDYSEWLDTAAPDPDNTDPDNTHPDNTHPDKAEPDKAEPAQTFSGSAEDADPTGGVVVDGDELAHAAPLTATAPALEFTEADASATGAPGTPISFAPEPRRWWVGVILACLGLVLVGQIFYFQLPAWSRDPGLRPIYQTVCGWFGCELPAMRDIREMRTRNLVVRSHPELSGALIVDAVIVNQAGFEQSFPDLELRFTAVGGQLVAGRRFTPAEYLAGELDPGQLMPPDTPVQVSLEIEDPGPDAVNYTLNFR